MRSLKKLCAFSMNMRLKDLYPVDQLALPPLPFAPVCDRPVHPRLDSSLLYHPGSRFVPDRVAALNGQGALTVKVSHPFAREEANGWGTEHLWNS